MHTVVLNEKFDLISARGRGRSILAQGAAVFELLARVHQFIRILGDAFCSKIILKAVAKSIGVLRTSHLFIVFGGAKAMIVIGNLKGEGIHGFCIRRG